ncbi:selenoneine biosynthesis selenosugar synthase SenB [Anaeromyxobacter paludicola]|uniref:Glycosyl transferase family 1 domain-containing protein n=1 Tax=Anaeromyxobacter paludicola TaxID=2918171 RepID=A0ABN6N7G3_9BACT|nr:selenoneine biosynthesis selenosugar synthase SenB [Anaeromyxobacter paludicola]BDG07882.1 hypothetical protein AMPC_09950 [Anaeromyxobacter paludicola]
MDILIVTPAGKGTRKGNRVTALRWAGHLRALGHRVRLGTAYAGEPCDLLVALHARRSHGAAAAFRAARSGAPLVVALTGTDLYQDLPASAEARSSLALASRLVVLQPRAERALPEEVRGKVRVIYQSARPVAPLAPPEGAFRVCLLAHLREVKDPLLAARAVSRLPASSRVSLVHLGAALDPADAARAAEAAAAEPRYRWLGDRPRREALRTLAGSRLLLVTSRLEGGANVVTEAIANRVPVLSTRIEGSLGLLGEDYPGYFPVGDAAALAALLDRAEREPAFLEELRARVEALAPLVAPADERARWRALLEELGGPERARPSAGEEE